MNTPFNKKALIIAAICVLTFICYRYTINNQFTNWDDDYYVTNDRYIKELNLPNLKVIFTEDITKNNYHPLCMLSLALNYHFSQLNPASYYLTNILIHIANVILIFFLVIQLCRQLKIDDKGQLFIGALCAVLFGVHPMHVESVAWIAERKDVLYAFFYFFGLLAYLRYINSHKPGWYIATFLLFVAACLSKPMAVVFPFSMIAIDFLYRRPWKSRIPETNVKPGALNYLLSRNPLDRIVVEKILFFASSLICGGFAFYTQNKTGAIASFSTLTLAERFMYTSYGFVMYVVKLFNPTYLSTFYPYPYRYISGYLPEIYYMAPILSLAILTVPIFLAWKYAKNKTYFVVTAFGIGYFFTNIMFVLQFVSVGAAIMADRYSYVAYFGLVFMVAYFINEIIRRSPTFKTAIMVVLLFMTGGLAYGTYQRTFAWHDSETLLTDAIEKYPMRALLSYKWRGNYYFDMGEYDKALEDYGVLVDLRSADARVYDKIAVIYTKRKDYKHAAEIFEKSLSSEDNLWRTYADRSMMHIMTGDTQNALKDFLAAYKLNQRAERLLADSCFQYVQSGRYIPAIRQYNMLLVFNSSNPFYYFYRGVSYFNTDNKPAAMADWANALRFNPDKDVKQSASYNLGVAYDGMGKDSLAVYYAEMAKEAGYNVTPEYLEGLRQKKKQQSHR